jgi:hypothetical protein
MELVKLYMPIIYIVSDTQEPMNTHIAAITLYSMELKSQDPK